MPPALYRAAALLLMTAQMTWVAMAANKDNRGYDNSGPLYLSIGTIGLGIALAAGSVRYDSLTIPAATVCLLSTAATAVYASTLDPQWRSSRAGYIASIFSMAACLFLIAADIAEYPQGDSCTDETNVYLVVPEERASFYRY